LSRLVAEAHVWDVASPVAVSCPTGRATGARGV
jgi:hypothetical protein